MGAFVFYEKKLNCKLVHTIEHICESALLSCSVVFVHLHGIALEDPCLQEHLGRHGKEDNFGFHLLILHWMIHSFKIFS